MIDWTRISTWAGVTLLIVVAVVVVLAVAGPGALRNVGPGLGTDLLPPR